MKKIITAVALVLAGILNAQEVKEGSVTYMMTIEGLPPEQAAMMGDMETKICFKDKKSYSEMNSMMYSMKSVTDENGVLQLHEQMGNKFFIKMTKAEAEKMEAENNAKEPTFEYTEETKKIAGYDCKKAIMTTETKEGPVKADIWYTDKITTPKDGGQKQFKALKGLPMEFTFLRQGMKMKMVAKEVSLSPIPDSKFVLSTEGYTELKAEDLKKKQGGGK